MLSNRLAFAAVSFACVAAAAGGGYLATRQNQASSAIAAPAPTAGATPAATPAANPVAAASNGAVATKNNRPAPTPAALSKRSDETDRPSSQTIKAGKPSSPMSARNAPLPTLERTWPGSQAGAAVSP